MTGVSQLDELASLRDEIQGIANGAIASEAVAAGAVAAGAVAREAIASGAAIPAADSSRLPASEPVSFGFGISSSLEEGAAAILASIRETLAKLAPVAAFETSSDGFTAKTVLNYSGLAVSVWSSGTTWGLVDAHLAALQQAYALRAAVVQVVAAVGNALVAISVAVANPLTVWHAVKSAEALKVAVDRLAVAVGAGG